MTEAMVPAVTAEQTQEIESTHGALLARAQELVVDSPEGEEAAWEIVNGIGALKKLIEADFTPSKQASHRAWKAICAQEKGYLDRLTEPDRIVRGKLSAYETEKRRRQAEVERQAREAAEAKARAEAEEVARRQAEERALEEAAAAEQAGDTARAEEILNQPVEIGEVEVRPEDVATPAAPAAPKVEGAGAMVETWHFKITDRKLIPREYLTVDEAAIRKVVQAEKGDTNIPGVHVWSTFEARRSGRGA